MATSGQLISTIAELCALPRHKAEWPWKALRDAGEVTLGSRGRGAPPVTLSDASKYLSGLAASFMAQDVVAGALDFCRLELDHSGYCTGSYDPKTQRAAMTDWHESERLKFEHLKLPALQTLKKRHTFQDALTATLTSAMDAAFIEAHAKSRRWSNATMLAHGIEIAFLGPEPAASIKVEFWFDQFKYAEEAVYLLPERIDQTPGNSSETEATRTSRYGRGYLKLNCEFGFEAIYGLADVLKNEARDAVA